MLKISDLAARSEFDAGPLHISPARRLIEGPAGSASLEPIVMKVFLLLLDGAGEVVTRDALFDSAWGGVIVGDDSLNRAIARVRKVANETAPGLFEIETIPRTGYRITGPIVEQLGAPVQEPKTGGNRLSRRTAIGAGAAAVAAVAGGGWWLSRRATDDEKFADLMQRGWQAMEYSDGSDKPSEIFRQALAIRPDDAAALGLFAYALVANSDRINSTEVFATQTAQEAASKSLRLDPNDANARLAMIQLERATLDLAGTEDRIRAILSTAPDSLLALQFLWNLLQSTGRSAESLALVERSLALRPLAAVNNYPMAQLLWIVGRVAEADRVIDRALISWPDHPYVRFAKFNILAFTGRPRAALDMLENPATRPQVYKEPSVALWRIALPALDNPSPANVAKARAAYLDAVKQKPNLANQAVMSLSALGQVDEAFDIANRLLLFRAPGEPSRQTQKSTAWRFTPWLFTPPVAAMRADARFNELCDGTGLTDYWRKRGVQPDYRRFKD